MIPSSNLVVVPLVALVVAPSVVKLGVAISVPLVVPFSVACWKQTLLEEACVRTKEQGPSTQIFVMGLRKVAESAEPM